MGGGIFGDDDGDAVTDPTDPPNFAAAWAMFDDGGGGGGVPLSYSKVAALDFGRGRSAGAGGAGADFSVFCDVEPDDAGVRCPLLTHAGIGTGRT